MHSGICTTTSSNDNADNIIKQAYLLDYHKYSVLHEMFSTIHHYPYTPQNLKFLTDKTFLFLLLQFENIYKNNMEIDSVSSKPPPSKKRRIKKKSNSKYL